MDTTRHLTRLLARVLYSNFISTLLSGPMQDCLAQRSYLEPPKTPLGLGATCHLPRGISEFLLSRLHSMISGRFHCSTTTLLFRSTNFYPFEYSRAHQIRCLEYKDPRNHDMIPFMWKLKPILPFVNSVASLNLDVDAKAESRRMRSRV